MRTQILKALVECYAPETVKNQLRQVETAQAVIREAQQDVRNREKFILDIIQDQKHDDRIIPKMVFTS